MLELEVGISGFEGCVSFLGFPPRKPSWLRKPRTPRDARVTMPCACGDHRVATEIWVNLAERVGVEGALPSVVRETGSAPRLAAGRALPQVTRGTESAIC